MTRFQVTIRCTACRHKYKRVLQAEDESALAYVPDPPCPACAHVQKAIGMDVAGGKAPAAIGSVLAKAVDTTAQIVMEDHRMTDLRDNVREGETMAPKLAPRLQAMADNMFARPNRKSPTPLLNLPPQQVLRAAVGGQFMTPDTVNPVATQHSSKSRAPIHIVAGDGVRPKG